jgi:N-acetylglutamate synthase-like GNAT family acetyltransferase
MNRFQVRRATVEDLPQLRSLWEMEALPVAALEKRFTEFQVAQDEQGQIVAALGLQTAQGQGLLHAECILRFDLAEELRAQLWPRLETLARNQGLTRLWTTLEAPFWKGVGFKKTNPQMLQALPALFAEAAGPWLQLPLRAPESGHEIEKQLAVLRTLSQAENQQLMDRARLLKWIAMGVFTAVFAGFAVWVIYYARLRSRLRRQRNKDW